MSLRRPGSSGLREDGWRAGSPHRGRLGDQFSDLIGGYGDPVKLPNPTYYLP